MPANLTHQYLKAEAAYRRATSAEEELHCLQNMLREIPKHKGTDKLQSDLKRKISHARKLASGVPSSAVGHGHRQRIPRQGAGRAVLIGAPNAGKSQLVTRLTRANPEVAPYPFTTHKPQPAMMPWHDVMVQLIDTPPITVEAFDSTLLGLLRGADVALLVIDPGEASGIAEAQRIIEYLQQTKTRLAPSSYLDLDDLGVSYTRTLGVLNKCDLPDFSQNLPLLDAFFPRVWERFPVSANTGEGLTDLAQAIFDALDVVRVYTKLPNNKEPDYDRPFTIQRGGTLLEIAQLIHKDLARNLKHARVWGQHVHDATTVRGDYVLHDQDIVELHI